MSESIEPFYYANVLIENIIPHPGVPERNVGDITKLTKSIEKVDVVQDVILEEAEEEGEYYRLAGKRRLEACRKAGKTHIYAKIWRKEMLSRKERLFIVHGENLDRKMRTAPYRARLYQEMVNAGTSQREIAELEGVTEQQISNIMRINELPREIQNLPNFEFFELSKCLILLTLREQPELQLALARRLNDAINEKGKCRLSDEEFREELRRLERERRPGPITPWIERISPPQPSPEPETEPTSQIPQPTPEEEIEPTSLTQFEIACPMKEFLLTSMGIRQRISRQECEGCRVPELVLAFCRRRESEG